MQPFFEKLGKDLLKTSFAFIFAIIGFIIFVGLAGWVASLIIGAIKYGF